MIGDATFIVELRCKQNGITPEELRKAPKTKSWTILRHELTDELRAKTNCSWGDIGYLLGRRSYHGKRVRVHKKT